MEGTDTFDPTCPECGGDGWWYVSPSSLETRHLPTTVDYIEVKCVFGQANLKPSLFENFGQFTFADAIMTFQDEARVSYRDRFIGIEQEMAWTELLESGGQGTTIAVGKSGRSTQGQKEAMRYHPLSVNFIADEDKVRYFPQADYKMLEETKAEPRRMKFLAGKGPTVGKLFTVHYNCRPTWIVDDATYGIQSLRGPEEGLKGLKEPQNLPTTFKVRLDYMTQAAGS
jgi:hypothetical protein